MTVMLLLVALVAGGLIGFQQFKAGILKQIVATIRSEVPTVATAKASMQEWQPRLTAVGSARASNGADLAAEIGGVVDQIDFESGQTVPAGTVLLRLRPNDDDAKLAQLQASAELANVTLQRDQKQLAAHGVAQATVDSRCGEPEGRARAGRRAAGGDGGKGRSAHRSPGGWACGRSISASISPPAPRS